MQEPRGKSCLLELFTVTKCCLLALFPWLFHGGSACRGLRPPTSVINGKTKTCTPPQHTQTSLCNTGLFADLHTLTRELPPHILWMRMSQNTGMWGPLGKWAVGNATCMLGEQPVFSSGGKCSEKAMSTSHVGDCQKEGKSCHHPFWHKNNVQ